MVKDATLKLAEERLRQAKAILAEYGRELPEEAAAYVDALFRQVEELLKHRGGERAAPWWDLGAGRLAQKRVIAGYASTFATEGPIQAGFSFWPGCWAEGLQRYRTCPVVLLDHDPNRPIGRTLELREDGRGLWAKVQIADDTGWANGVWLLIAAGLLDSFSVRLDPTTARTQQMWGAPVVVKAGLIEVSVVTRPLDSRARFKIVPGPHPEVTIADIKETRRLVTHFKRPDWWPPSDEPNPRPWF